MMGALDKFENHPKYYTRTEEEFVMLEVPGGSGHQFVEGGTIKAGLYILKNFRKDLLDLQFLTIYNSNDTRKTYVKP